MKKATSLSELGFDANGASSVFFRPVSDSSTPTSHRRRLTKVSVIGAGNVGMAIDRLLRRQPRGPDYMVRNAKRSMLEELEGMLEIVDPQPPGKSRTLSRRKFDLPEGGAIPKEMRDGVKNVVRIVEEGK